MVLCYHVCRPFFSFVGLIVWGLLNCILATRIIASARKMKAMALCAIGRGLGAQDQYKSPQMSKQR